MKEKTSIGVAVIAFLILWITCMNQTGDYKYVLQIVGIICMVMFFGCLMMFIEKMGK